MKPGFNVGKKQGHLQPGDSGELGANYIFWCIDGNTKLVPCHWIGKRNDANTHLFI